MPDIEAMPPETLVTPVILSIAHNAVPRSASVSLNNTGIVTVTFLFVEALSFTATGVSLMQITSIVPVAILLAAHHNVSPI